ncbi:unnamed protein product [Nezara viridula]|uniref:Uncharacterized protein n=1 Tax=Nezara viridula TaxID=85310 RepID=A0A9P0H6W2_NEZVI|nr:unnamed protein product [Nezara viridula]
MGKTVALKKLRQQQIDYSSLRPLCLHLVLTLKEHNGNQWADGKDAERKPITANALIELASSIERARGKVASSSSQQLNKDLFRVDKNDNNKKCRNCDWVGAHVQNPCPARKAIYRKWFRRGYYACCCREKRDNMIRGIKQEVDMEEQDSDAASCEGNEIKAIHITVPRAAIDVRLNGFRSLMEFDSGENAIWIII